MLQTERYAEVVREYGSTLEDDPAYLVYHHTSTALRLQFLLKDEDFPALCIGDCIDQRLGECCVVAALREAIRRGEVGVRDRK